MATSTPTPTPANSGEWALHEAIHTALSADTDVATYLGSPARLYDHLPEELIFPYASYGRQETKPLPADPGESLEVTGRIHVWSRYGGRRETRAALYAVRNVIHLADLTLVDWTLVSLRAVFTDVLRGRDGFTHQGIIRYRGVVEVG